MDSISEKALLLFRQSEKLKSQRHDWLKEVKKSFAMEEHGDAITETAYHNQQTDPVMLIQNLNTRLHVHMSGKDYDSALKDAIVMQNLVPESYYGYHRTAQIHLIRNEYEEAYRAYYNGFKATFQQDDIELLCKSAVETQHIFDQAASELAKIGQFDKANRIVNSMTLLAPASPLGYLRAGELYEMQGKSKAALVVYLQGISSISCNKQLVERMTNLQERIDRVTHYDFIMQLPLEITASIVQYLDTCELVECMSISESWRDRIQQCPEAWRVLDVEYPGTKMNITTFQQIKPFVQKVAIKHATSNTSFLHDLLTLIGNDGFKNLTYLKLDSDTMEPQYKQSIIRILEQVNLTGLDLEFVFNKQESYIPLHRILESCPHLKELAYHTDAFPTRISYSLLPQQPTMITHLSIGGYPYHDETVENPSFFIPLIPLFPHLVWLCITDNGPGDLQIITERCYSLRILIVIHGYPYTVPMDLPYSASAPKGLQYLKIDGFVEPEEVAGIVAKNTNTLETASIHLEYADLAEDQRVDPNWNWERLSKINCPVLKKLHMSIDYYWPFDQWIGECPALTDIKLECESITDGSASADSGDDDDSGDVIS